MARKAAVKDADAGSVIDPVNILKKLSKKGGVGDFVPSRPLVSTGSVALDMKLGGGAPSDRVIEIYGASGSYKTNLALMLLKNRQAATPDDKRLTLIVDLERTQTITFVKGFGIDTDQVWVERCDTAEDTMNIVSDSIRSGAVKTVLIDSIDAMESVEDTQKSYGEASMMKLAKLLSEAMRDLSKACVDHDCMIILINQVRAGSNGYQIVQTTSGGAAIPFYATLRLKVKRSKDARTDAAFITVDVAKNKMFPMVMAETSFYFVPGVGIDVASDRLEAGKQIGTIVQRGSVYDVLTPEDQLIITVKGSKGFESWLLEKGNLELFDGIIKQRFKDELEANRKQDEEVETTTGAKPATPNDETYNID
jgi:recombination protein RecA